MQFNDKYEELGDIAMSVLTEAQNGPSFGMRTVDIEDADRQVAALREIVMRFQIDLLRFQNMAYKDMDVHVRELLNKIRESLKTAPGFEELAIENANDALARKEEFEAKKKYEEEEGPKIAKAKEERDLANMRAGTAEQQTIPGMEAE